MSFKDVYRVTLRNELVPNDAVDQLAREIAVPLPEGYREYVTTLGNGELCDWLRVMTPEGVRRDLDSERDRHAIGMREGFWQPHVLTPHDMEESVTFATSAEGDSFICCPRFGMQLFELPRHDNKVGRLEAGFFGAVASGVIGMEHDFAFFEPWPDGRRRYRGFELRLELSANDYIEEVTRRWGSEGFRRSRSPMSREANHPNLFFRAIEGRMVLYLDENYLPRSGCFQVAMSYDSAYEDEVAAFVKSVAMPGMTSWVR